MLALQGWRGSDEHYCVLWLSCFLLYLCFYFLFAPYDNTVMVQQWFKSISVSSGCCFLWNHVCCLSFSAETLVWGGGSGYIHTPIAPDSPDHQPPPLIHLLHIQPAELWLELPQLWLLLHQIFTLWVLQSTLPEDWHEAHWVVRGS